MSSSERFHKAAKDGLLAYLKDATRKDANAKDEDWMTPVLWAAFEGHLDALRLLCAKGGDPDKCDQFGNTALHLASAKGHLHCVEFLVKFGVNIYALDIDKHSAKDLAAINNRDEILRYLDSSAARLEANDRKKAKNLREIAEKNCEKHIRDYLKRQQKFEPDYADLHKPQKPHGLSSQHSKSTNMLHTLKQKIWSSHGNLSKTPKENTKFSELVSNTGTGSQHSSTSGGGGGSFASRSGHGNGAIAMQQKLKSDSCVKQHSGSCGTADDGGFKIGEITENDGRRTISSLTGLQRDSEVLYVGTFETNDDGSSGGSSSNKRGKIAEVFDVDVDVDEMPCSDTEGDCRDTVMTLSRSYSQPDILSDSQKRYEIDRSSEAGFLQRPPGLFDRPMLGSIAFRRSITAALSQLNPESSAMNDCEEIETESKTGTTTRSNSTNSKNRSSSGGGGCSGNSGKPRNFLNISDSDTESDDDGPESGGSPIQRFLTVWGLEEYLPVFERQQIDLDTLMLLTESDLKSLKSLPLGPFRKLTFAIQERKSALANPGIMQDTCL